jgi:transmembrane sensor
VADLYEEAAAWVARLDGRAPAADERARFDAWIGRSPAHATAYEEALRTWRDLAAMRGSEQYRALLGNPTLRERLISAARAPRWAAVAVGTAAVAAVAWLGLSSDALPFLRRPTQMTTQIAEVRETTLPDGTRIVLGAQSQIDFELTEAARRATVVAGDAFFSVAHDPARPFTVAIDHLQVRVVGTQFEIRRRAGAISVAVSEGKVAVKRAGTSDEAIVLGPGSALTARPAGSLISPVEPLDIGAWRSGRLVYDDAELRDIVADANRYAGARLVIADAQLEKLRLTTSYSTSQIDGMIETLQAALPLVVERQANGDILLRARQ